MVKWVQLLHARVPPFPSSSKYSSAMAKMGKSSEKPYFRNGAQVFVPLAQQVADFYCFSHLSRIHTADHLKAINQCPKFHPPMSPCAQFS